MQLATKPITTATKLATLQHNGPSARAQPLKAVSVTWSERRTEQPRN